MDLQNPALLVTLSQPPILSVTIMARKTVPLTNTQPHVGARRFAGANADAEMAHIR